MKIFGGFQMARKGLQNSLVALKGLSPTLVWINLVDQLPCSRMSAQASESGLISALFILNLMGMLSNC